MAPQDAARLWGTIYAQASSRDRSSLMRLLKAQATFRAELRAFLKIKEAKVSRLGKTEIQQGIH